MTTCTIHYSEVIDLGDGPEEGDVADISYQCSYSCMRAEMTASTGLSPWEWHDVDKFAGRAGTFILGDENSGTAYSYGECPGGDETQTDEYCGQCGTHLWHGLSCYDEHDDPDERDDEDETPEHRGHRMVCGAYAWTHVEIAA